MLKDQDISMQLIDSKDMDADIFILYVQVW